MALGWVSTRVCGVSFLHRHPDRDTRMPPPSELYPSDHEQGVVLRLVGFDHSCRKQPTDPTLDLGNFIFHTMRALPPHLEGRFGDRSFEMHDLRQGVYTFVDTDALLEAQRYLTELVRENQQAIFKRPLEEHEYIEITCRGWHAGGDFGDWVMPEYPVTYVRGLY